MWEAHADLLKNFQTIHDEYKSNQRSTSAKKSFDLVGKDARNVMESWDQRLCQQMERGHNGVFSSKVSEKFWLEVKKDFPLIDLVGVTVEFV